MSPQLADDFDSLRRGNNLDLASRKGKQPGGYQATLDEAREPFIFMNAAGLQRDVETLLHEGGHAFHALAARDEPLVFLRHAPIEFCEVASMSMELLGADHFDVFYADPADAARAKRVHLEGIIRLLPVDRDDRLVPALALHAPGPLARRSARRSGSACSTASAQPRASTGPASKTCATRMWQRQLHLFHATRSTTSSTASRSSARCSSG